MANVKISELSPLVTVQDADVLPIVDNAVTKKVTAAILRSYTQGNSVLLTGAQTVAGIKTFTSQLASSVATGTAPFSVASTTKVTNLNADLLDGLSSADFQATLSGTGIVKSTAGTISYLTDNSTNWNTAFNERISTLTTTGSSGAATLSSNTLNIPNYTLSGLGGVPYTGATADVNLGTHSLTASDLVINHASGSGVAASITKGGAGEALTVVKSSGSGNAASITGGTTLISELNLTTDLADAYIASAATWNAKQNAITLTTTGTSGAATLVGSTLNIPNYADTDTGITSLNGLTALTQTLAVGTSGTDFGISSATSTHTFNLPTASAANRGALSSADWTTFNNKQNALTNPITGTGTTNYLPKFTGASALGNSLLYEEFSIISIGTTIYEDSLPKLNVSGTIMSSNASLTAAPTIASVVLDYHSPSNGGRLMAGSGGNWNKNICINPYGGNTLIGTTTDAGYKLYVNGTARVSGAATFSSSVQANGGLYTNSFVDGGFARFNYSTASAGSRSWRIANDVNTYGDFVIQQSTTQSGSTFANKLSFSNAGDATFSGATSINGAAIANTVLTLQESASLSGALGMANRNSTQSYRFAVDSLAIDDGNFCIINSNAASIPLTITPSGTSIFIADATINGVTVGKGAGSIATNTAVGFEAAYSNTIGTDITAIGYQALRLSTGSRNTAFGVASNFQNTTGADNVTMGDRSLRSNTTGSGNSVLGGSAAYSNVSGGSNVVMGNASLYNNVTGSNNTALGTTALLFNTASNNTAVGFEAGFSNTSGENITAIGYRALKANSTGGYNTAVGWAALSPNTTGLHNTAVGNNCLYDNITGNNNVVIGSEQGTGNYGNCIMLGRGDIATGGQQVRFGSAAIPTSPVVVGANVSSQYWNVFINGVAQKILLA